MTVILIRKLLVGIGAIVYFIDIVSTHLNVLSGRVERRQGDVPIAMKK